MKKKISCIVQARFNSKRFPGKVMLPVVNKPLLQHQLERLKKSNEINDLILATTIKKDDNQLCKVANLLKVKVFRGDEKNVLKRYYDCAKNNKSSIIVRVTADCPLIDVKYIDKLIKIFLKKNYDYLSNLNIDYIPDGFHCEIFKFSSLEKAYKLANSKFHREHVTSFLWSNPKLFLVHHFKGKKLKNHSNKIRLTLDYKPDYILIKKIFEKLYRKNKYFSLNEITNYLKKNQSLLKINQKYHKLQWNKFHKKRNKYLKKND